MVLISVWSAWRAGVMRAQALALTWLHGTPSPAGPAVGVADAAVCDELPVPPERPWGCGWFDSSLDLREGLAVIEHEGNELELALVLMFDAASSPVDGAPPRFQWAP